LSKKKFIIKKTQLRFTCDKKNITLHSRKGLSTCVYFGLRLTSENNSRVLVYILFIFGLEFRANVPIGDRWPWDDFLILILSTTGLLGQGNVKYEFGYFFRDHKRKNDHCNTRFSGRRVCYYHLSILIVVIIFLSQFAHYKQLKKLKCCNFSKKN